MKSELIERLNTLSTPHLADACLRVGVTVRCAPTALRPLIPSMHCAGRVRPVRHSGSVYFLGGPGNFGKGRRPGC